MKARLPQSNLARVYQWRMNSMSNDHGDHKLMCSIDESIFFMEQEKVFRLVILKASKNRIVFKRKKTLQEKDILLVTSIVSLFQKCFPATLVEK